MGKNYSTLRVRRGSKKSSSFTTHKTEDVLSDSSIVDEVARLDELHFLQKELWDKTIFSAPITKQLEEIHGFRVLDVG